MKVAVMLIATGGERYTKYVTPLVESLEKFFPPQDVVLFTDSQDSFDAIKIYQPNLGWPRASLMRYHAILAQKSLLERYDQIFYMDIDMLVHSKIDGEEVFSDGITAVLHPCFPTSFERRPQSTAFISGNPPYYQGCLQGGSAKAFLEMCETLARNIDTDDANGIVAVWFDESHLNRYLVDNPPAKILSPSYAYPTPNCLVHPETWMEGRVGDFVPKIRHIEKVDQNKWK
jgi:hypothetical protein